MSTPADAPTLPPVDSFVQAMSQLMAFEQEFGPMQSALVVDGDGAVRDGVALTADWHTADHALRVTCWWATASRVSTCCYSA